MAQVSISSFALLVSLNISQWSARKYDRKVSDEAARAHAASKDAGRFNKLLIPAVELKPVQQAARVAVAYHNLTALSWDDNGGRILPSAIFAEYSAAMRKHRLEFERTADEFTAKYPQLVQDARKHLGTMYDPQDFPPDIRSKFSFKVSCLPMPNVDDFRVNLNSNALALVKEQATQEINDRVDRAVKELFDRAREIVNTIYEQTGIKGRKIFDSSIENARRFVELLPALNLTKNSLLLQAESDIRALLVDPEKLRKSPTLRKAIAKAAEETLVKLGC
jgi:hypothetical protein